MLGFTRADKIIDDVRDAKKVKVYNIFFKEQTHRKDINDQKFKYIY